MPQREQDFEWDVEDPGVVTIDLALISQDLTGATGRWLLATLAGTVVATLSGGDVVVTESPKQMTVTLEAVDTTALTAGWHLHQAFITRSGAEEEKVAEGRVLLFQKLS